MCPQMPQTYAYKAGPIEPIVQIDEVVGVWVNKNYQFGLVTYIEGIPYSKAIEVDFGALAAGATGAIAQLTLIQMPDFEFGQFRGEVLDNFSALLSQGRGAQRFKTELNAATYTLEGARKDPCGHMGEFYVYEDNNAFITPTNEMAYGLTQSRMIFWGFRFVVQNLPQYSWEQGKLPDKWTRIPAMAHI